MPTNLRMVITGGGTGGHFFPAKTISKALQKKGVKIQYIGSKFGLENTLYSEISKDALLLNIRGIQRHISIKSALQNLLFPIRFIYSYYESFKLILKFKPHVVIGTGGYASGIPLLVAIHNNINTIIQEQNSSPGITTRYLASRVNKVCLAYNTLSNTLKNNFIITGNPIREDIKIIDSGLAKAQFNFHSDSPVVSILGGSQGSSALNNYFMKNYQKYTGANIQLIWQCGNQEYDYIKNNINDSKIALLPFSNNMSAIYSASDIIISRSGALALSEMALMGKAMILIPFPQAAGDHQTKNAVFFSESGAAILLPQSQLDSKDLEKIVIELIQNPNKIKNMSKQSKKLSTPDATKTIINNIMELAKKNVW